MKTLSIKAKLGLSLALLVVLAMGSSLSNTSSTTIARVLLGVAISGGAWWVFSARRGGRSRFSLPKRVNVIQRIGLSQRSGLLLVEIDSQPFVILHGDGFATLKRTRRQGTPRAIASPHEAAPQPNAPGVPS